MDLIISSATHRSGSTLLQRLFNARKETLIWGENGGCLTEFYKILDHTKHHANFNHWDTYLKSREDANQWIACMTPPKHEVDAVMIQTVSTFHEELYVKKYNKQHDMIGYKEVRYGREELGLLRKCYPNCTIILLVRNPIDIWKSMSQRKGIKKMYGSLEGFTNIWNVRVNSYLLLSKSDPNIHLVKYEDIVARKAETINLIKQVGHLEEKDVNPILSNKINSSSKAVPEHTIKFIMKQCGLIMRKVGYLP
ncbi:sulfotransferase [Priestia aryabhattai]|uniref:sulfotransferase n=1 Tax=Priestia aryabhattai TaxID=412384 RepID=UPI0039835631